MKPEHRRSLLDSILRIAKLIGDDAPEILIGAELSTLHRKSLAVLGEHYARAIYDHQVAVARGWFGICPNCGQHAVASKIEKFCTACEAQLTSLKGS